MPKDQKDKACKDKVDKLADEAKAKSIRSKRTIQTWRAELQLGLDQHKEYQKDVHQ